MFGVIVSGRAPVTTFETLSQTQIQFRLPGLPRFNYLVVFLLPGQIVPEASQANVFLQLSPNAPFLQLGAITSDKPSKIFRIRNVSGHFRNGIVDEDLEIDYSSMAQNSSSDYAGDVSVGIELVPRDANNMPGIETNDTMIQDDDDSTSRVVSADSGVTISSADLAHAGNQYPKSMYQPQMYNSQSAQQSHADLQVHYPSSSNNPYIPPNSSPFAHHTTIHPLSQAQIHSLTINTPKQTDDDQPQPINRATKVVFAKKLIEHQRDFFSERVRNGNISMAHYRVWEEAFLNKLNDRSRPSFMNTTDDQVDVFPLELLTELPNMKTDIWNSKNLARQADSVEEVD